MKKAILPALALLLFAFTSIKFEATKGTAEVNQIQGLYIFTDSKPVKEYEYLGTVKTSSVVSVGSTQYQPVRDKMIKKLKKDFPEADGAIFFFNNGSSDKCDAIKFK